VGRNRKKLGGQVGARKKKDQNRANLSIRKREVLNDDSGWPGAGTHSLGSLWIPLRLPKPWKGWAVVRPPRHSFADVSQIEDCPPVAGHQCGCSLFGALPHLTFKVVRFGLLTRRRWLISLRPYGARRPQPLSSDRSKSSHCGSNVRLDPLSPPSQTSSVFRPF